MTLSTTAAARSPWVPSRGALFAALALLGATNAVVSRGLSQIVITGSIQALEDGLGASWALWLALALAIRLALNPGSERTSAPPVGRWDLAVAAVCLVLVVVPVRQLGAVAATITALWFIARPGGSARLRAAAIILLAISVSLLWTHVLLVLLARQIELVDARLVAFFAHTQAHDNVVTFVHGGNSFLLITGCTSVQNASLALLLWIAIARSARPQTRPRDLLIGLGVFLTVVAINIARLSLMAQSRPMFLLVHSHDAALLIEALITISGLAWAVFDVRRELFR